jgi:hypothetical protein
VREAAKRADDLHAEVYDEEASKKEEGEGAPPAEDQQAEPQAEAGAVAPADQGAGEPAPAPAPPAPAPPPEETVDHWRNKFKTLEGKYRAEVPRYSSQLRDANARIQHLEQTLASVNDAAPAKQDANGVDKPLVTPEELEEYGEDFVSMMRRLAQEEAGRAVKAVTPRIEEVREQVQRTTAQTQSDRVYALLDSSVEDWRTINRSPEFLSWLGEEDPYVGETRAVMLREAFDRKDEQRVLAFFNGYIKQRNLVAPAQPQTPPARTPQVDLASLAGPRGGNGVGAPAPKADGPQPWTRRQIAAFFKDVQTGVYRSDPDKQKRLERSIEEAGRAGLITP